MTESWANIISKEIDDVEKFIIKQLNSDNPELEEMCRYVIEAGGKRVRPIVCILSHLACGGTDINRAISIGSAFEIVHSATLIHDDINDGGELRRGRKTLHKKYTLTKAIVAGDFMLIRGYQALGPVGDEIMEIIVKAASMMSESEFIQKDNEHKSTVTEDTYYDIISGKTAMLICASAMSGAYIATDDADKLEAIRNYSYKIGMAFQIIDDLLDVIGVTTTTGKKVGLDLMEGKPTLPIIYAMEDEKLGEELKTIFNKSEASDEDVKRALQIISETDSIPKCRAKADEIINEAIDALMELPESQYRDSLEGLAKYIASRNR